jgi:hypothetical protein
MRLFSRRKRGTTSSSFMTISRRNPDPPVRERIPSASSLIASALKRSRSAAHGETIFALACVWSASPEG